jgi:CDGSH-type Zn-finger protein
VSDESTLGEDVTGTRGRDADDGAARPDDRDHPWASITACPNGPLLVRGDVEILLADGEPAPRRRQTVALCRCGASAIKPFCDGSHKVVGFRTDDEPRAAATATPDAREPGTPTQQRDRRGLRSA